MSNSISYIQVRRGEWAGLSGEHYIGRVVGDYATGFEAQPLDGRRFMGLAPFATIEEAFQMLEMEFSAHYGERVSA